MASIFRVQSFDSVLNYFFYAILPMIQNHKVQYSCQTVTLFLKRYSFFLLIFWYMKSLCILRNTILAFWILFICLSTPSILTPKAKKFPTFSIKIKSNTWLLCCFPAYQNLRFVHIYFHVVILQCSANFKEIFSTTSSFSAVQLHYLHTQVS